MSAMKKQQVLRAVATHPEPEHSKAICFQGIASFARSFLKETYDFQGFAQGDPSRIK